MMTMAEAGENTEAFQLLQDVATSGIVPKDQWKLKMREVFEKRMIEFMDSSNERTGFVGPVDQTFVKRRNEICDLLHNYEFTIQRLAEVLLAPRERQYCATHKLCNAIEKLLSVSSGAASNVTLQYVRNVIPGVQTATSAEATLLAETKAEATLTDPSSKPTSAKLKSPTALSCVDSNGNTLNGSPTGSGTASRNNNSSNSHCNKYVHSATPTAAGKSAVSRKRLWGDEGAADVDTEAASVTPDSFNRISDNCSSL